ncbi:hypothetical protein [Trichococcus palustris]|nr:hypothetical protein [Trichococcus palustris]
MMKLTKEQISICKKMEENGGPKSYAGAMLYHQYKLQKEQITIAKNTGEEKLKDQLIQKVQEIQMLRNEIEDKQQQLGEKKIELEALIETIGLLND